ncbi:uncharacterized protein K444DRAFT_588846 [Hyaloscypha bicolor E]|uniref:Uncharacterized protein n=1 Tax=Hyaloscypha bicolor E TaxID=1095630 RepID=A0A2J6TB85_9HELO|nr:uncharacterized protein K444DRAFT_588846 [Hyaloscypha bicolor E]PMD60285.1 hypothetical protein K444DRAFT_588846 [Hyaloscypha bicolor E]
MAPSEYYTSETDNSWFQLNFYLIDVLNGDFAPEDRSALVLLGIRAFDRATHRLGKPSKLKFEISFTCEQTQGTDGEQNEFKILERGLFSLDMLSHTYRPIPTADPTYTTLKISDIPESPSRVSLVVDEFPVQGEILLRIAVSIQQRPEDDIADKLGFYPASFSYSIEDLSSDVLPASIEFGGSVGWTIPEFTPGAELRGAALRWAAAHGWVEYLNLYLKRGGTAFDLEDNDGRTPLSLAAANGCDKVVEWLLEKGEDASTHKVDHMGRSALSWSVGNGQVETMKVLLAKGKEHLSQGDNDGRTPLSWAAENGHDKIVELLLNGDYKVDADQADKNDRTPLFWAAKSGRHRAVLSLLRFGNRFASGHSEARQQPVDFDHMDNEGRTPLSWAAQNEHGEVIRILTKEGLQRHPELNTGTPESPSWATSYLHEAAKVGSIQLTKLLIEGKIKVDNLLSGESTSKSTSNNTRTPLCTAAENGHVQIVELLVNNQADRNFRTPEEGVTPILFAVRKNRERVVEILAQAGCDISLKSNNNESPKDVAIKMNYGSILKILAKRDEDGPLAETWEALNHDIDKVINATIVDFFTESDIQPYVRERSVNALLENPRLPHEKNNASPSYRWIHLPANNMKWVEILISKLYENPTLAYHILSSERWVRRQHRGASGVDHARFMRPLCQSFSSVSGSRTVSRTRNIPQPDRTDLGMNFMLFMPYLHWDLEEQQKKRRATIEELRNRKRPVNTQNSPNAVAQDGDDDRHQKLLRAYLRDKNDLPHQLHVRRTLDQYYYHAMEDTAVRDGDQVISRYQAKKGIEPKVLTMVDQLWLWVLDGTDGRLKTVVTCFPSRMLPPEMVGSDSTKDPDPKEFTDVLGHIKSHFLAEPLSVKTAYDLASVITSKCSRAYLDNGSMEENLRFSEVYETAISDLMSKGMLLFDKFTTLTKALDNVEYTSEIIKTVTDPSVDADSVIELCEKYHDNSFRESDLDVLKLLNALQGTEKKKRALDLLKKIGRIQILDITEEIEKLREVKDIQDELSIMSMLYEDQKKVLVTMDSIIRSNLAMYSRSQVALQERENLEVERPGEKTLTNALRMEVVDDGEYRATQAGEGSPQPEKINLKSKDRPVEVTQDHDHKKIFRELKAGSDESNKSKRFSKNQLTDSMFETGVPSKQPSLALAAVQVSIDEIDRMSQRARQANQALDFLVDLKQKQSNVLDARSARIQAEESLKMTKENERQGKTLMVFTVVTIIFLPLSFLAAFFAINITQFHRDAAGTLGLGYVSEIMFPISGTITAVLIYVAFKVEDLLGGWRWTNMQLQAALKNSGTGLKKLPLTDVEEGPTPTNLRKS